MGIREKISESVLNFLKEKYGQDVDAEQVQIDYTRKEFEGDFTLVVFPFVRIIRTKPEEAGELLGSFLLDELDEVLAFNVIKGFLNLKLTDAYWSKELASALDDSSWFEPAPKVDTVLVEYSSPNTNKPLHLGHLRNIFLGDSVSKIKAFQGSEVVRTQIINDRGVHICKSMFAWKMHANGQTPADEGVKGDKYVGKYYVMYDEHLRAQVAKLVKDGMPEDQAKKEAWLSRQVQEMLVKWEAKDEETRALWQMMNAWVYEGFAATYGRMGVAFDKLYYESDTYTIGKDVVIKGIEDGLFFKKDDGSVWVDLKEDGLDEKLLIRADGTTVYMTQDIGTAIQRFKDYPTLKQVVYTVGDEQDYHFKVLFLILQKLGFDWAPACKHLSYGMVDLPSGKMKSREGTVVDADDLMEEVVAAAKESSLEKGKLDEMTTEEQNELFETLGIGALKFYLLRVDPRKRMLFNPEESVSLQGDTGPFTQYTYARCQAVLRKSGESSFDIASDTEIGDKERALLSTLGKFRQVVEEAADGLNPSLVGNYILDVAKLYNQFYHDIHILNAEGSDRSFRLGLTKLTAQTIKSALSLLGIRVPERM